LEPLPADDPYRRLDNVLATAHIGYMAEEFIEHSMEMRPPT